MRTMACVWVAKGLFNWAVLMGLNPRFGDFAMLPRPLQTTIVFFAGADLLAAIGMWLAAPWGGVLWLLCAALEAISPLFGGRAALLGAVGVGAQSGADRDLFHPQVARRPAKKVNDRQRYFKVNAETAAALG